MRSVAQRLPVVSEGREWAERGALLTYAPDYFAMWTRAAGYVDKIPKGAKRADLPIEQPTKFVLSVNARVAKTLRLPYHKRFFCRQTKLSSSTVGCHRWDPPANQWWAV